MAEKKKRRDWTKVDVKDVKEHLPKILLFLVIILPLIYIGYLSWINIQNANIPNVNSGVTTETKIYNADIGNKTLIPNKTGTVSDTDSNSLTDLVKLMISWFPMILVFYLLVKVLGFLWDRD